MSFTVREIVELDRKNMVSIFKEIDIEYDPGLRAASLVQEISEGAEIITLRKDEQLAGYIELLPKAKGEIVVQSLQVSPEFQNTAILLILLRKAIKYINFNKFSVVSSGVHRCNTKSIKLHELFGFVVSKSTDKVVYFEKQL